MDVIRMPFNPRAQSDIRSLESRLGRPGSLADSFQREIQRPPRAIYLGVYDGHNLVGCARVVPGGLDAVLLDALEVMPEHTARRVVERMLLSAAGVIAREDGKRLSVIAEAQSSQRWSELGFRPDAYTVLTLA